MNSNSNNPGPGLSRRRMLGGMTAILSGCCFPGIGTAKTSRWIDIHHHFVPPAYRKFFAEAQRMDPSVVVPPTTWDLRADLDDMDRGGTSIAVLSMFVPPETGTPEMRARLARDINESAAALVRDHPQRFASLAALPLPDVDACLKEIAYSADQLHSTGFCVYTNVGNRWLGDASFEPVFAELDRRNAVLFVHPTTADCCRNLLPGIPDNIIEYGHDTSRAIASVVYNGVTSRYPSIQFVFSHGGGTVPFLIERFLGGTRAEIVPGITTVGQSGPYVPRQPPQGVLHELRRLHYDTAQCANPVAMRALRTVVPVSQILYGTDYFYRTAAETGAALRHCGVFSSDELKLIAAGNARRLMPRLD